MAGTVGPLPAASIAASKLRLPVPIAPCLPVLEGGRFLGEGVPSAVERDGREQTQERRDSSLKINGNSNSDVILMSMKKVSFGNESGSVLMETNLSILIIVINNISISFCLIVC